MAEIIGGNNPDKITGGAAQIWRTGTGQDPARYLIGPGTITSPGVHSPGNLRHARPYLTDGKVIFGFPVGPEAFTKSGAAALGLHRNIGGNHSRGRTVNYNEGRIELSGTFPGITSVDKLRACENMLVTPQNNGLLLYVPGIFNVLRVLPENWSFVHGAEDRTHSIDYTISFVIIGVGGKVSDPKGKPPAQNPSIKKKPKGKPTRIFTVKAGVRTFRAIARTVYNDADEWQLLVQKNQGQLVDWNRDHASTPSHQLPTYRWPIGTKFAY